MSKRLFLLFTMLFACFLAAEEESSPSLVDLSRSPIPRVAGSVNLVSGNFIEQTLHQETSGVEPFLLGTSYISATQKCGSLACNWNYFQALELQVEYASILQNFVVVTFEDAEGSHLLKGDCNCNNMAPQLDNTGYTVIGSIADPVRRDAKRIQAKHLQQDRWEITLGDGTRRLYEKRGKQKHLVIIRYRIIEERLPTGNLRLFTYNKHKHLKAITTVSSDRCLTMNKVVFSRRGKTVVATTSDGLETSFLLTARKKDTKLVRESGTTGTYRTRYAYKGSKKASNRKIKMKRESFGGLKKISYYEAGWNRIGEKKVWASSSGDFLLHRVKNLQTKAYANNQPSTLYNFYYRKWRSDYFETVAQECDGYSTRILWNPSKKPVWSGQYDQKERRLRSEQYVWGRDEDDSRLVRRTISDNHKHPILSRKSIYDDRGNVIKEIYQGHFTGYCMTPMKRVKNKKVTGGELAIIEATYSQDSRSLKTSERDALGNWTYFEYDPYRDLLTARFTCDKQAIVKREFFSYNSAGVCTESIIDDGSSRDKNNLQDVTSRRIVRIKPRLSMPYFGSPDETQIYAWTVEAGESFFSGEKNFRDDHGRIIRTEKLDTNGAVYKTSYCTYDYAHRLTKIHDSTGYFEAYCYDSAGRLSSKTTPESTVYYTLDLLLRPIQEKKVFPDGSSETLCMQYDLTGKTVKKIDSRGRETIACYDNCGRLVEKVLPSFTSISGGVEHPKIINDYQGSLCSTIHPNGSRTEAIYSATGQILKARDAHGALTRYYYDLKGRLIRQIDPSGLITKNIYDALDHLIITKQFRASKDYGKKKYHYNRNTLSDERHSTKIVRYTYDRYGRKASETTIDRVTGDESTLSYTYDSVHQLIKTVHHDTQVEEHFAYDNAGRVIERRFVAQDGRLLSIETSSYDAAGRCVEQGVGRNGTIAKTTTIYGAYGRIAKIIAPDETVTQFFYQPLWRADAGMLYLKKTTLDPCGTAIEELLDANDQQRDVCIKNCMGEIVSHRGVSVNVLGKPVLIGDDLIVNGTTTQTIFTSLDYNAAGELTKCVLAANSPDQAIYRYVYDAFGRKIQDVKPSGVTVNSFFDRKGRLKRMCSSDGSIDYCFTYNIQDLPTVIQNKKSGNTTLRTYDGLGHLIKEQLENSLAISYSVDPGGRLRSITYPDQTFASYEYKDGFLQTISRKDYQYHVISRDLSGRVTSACLPANAGVLTQTFDNMGRRVSIEHVAFTEQRTQFDPIGNCLARTVDGVEERFSYDSLSQLTSDAGRSLSFDSLHRRTESKGAHAEHNARHQMLSHGKERFFYDLDGRRVKDAAASLTYDALDRLIAIEDETTRSEFAYDAFNRRVSSTTYAKKDGAFLKTAFERYLWQQNCEIGSYDDSSARALRLLSDGIGGEIGSAVAYELDGELFVPVHDLCGNVRACLNHYGEVVEKLSYTAFGPESTQVGVSPWTFASKRQDPHFGLIFFGERFYDPHTATWLTQDPLGFSAGPNLYAYVKNNPLVLYDLFGLFEFSDVCNYISAAVSWIADTFSSLFDSFFSSSDCSSSNLDTDPSRHAAFDQDSCTLQNGFVVHRGDFQTSETLFYPYGNRVDCANHCLESGKTVCFMADEFGGMGTDLFTLCKRADGKMSGNKEIDFVRLVCTADPDFFQDLMGAGKDVLGIQTEQRKQIREEYKSDMNFFAKAGIEVKSISCAHSHGAASMRNLGVDLSKEPYYRDFLLAGIAVGSPVPIPTALCVVCVFDPICLFMLLDPVGLIQTILNGNLKIVLPTSVEFPHNYENRSYKNEVRNFLRGS